MVMKLWNRVLLISSLCISTIGCDQITKSLATEHLPRGEMMSFFGDFLRIGYTENTGAFLSLGSSLPAEMRFLIFVVGVGALLAGLLFYLALSKQQTFSSVLGLSLILGGGLSNFYDRAINNGAVVDFLNLGVGPVRTGVFNVADIAIMTGLTILILVSFKPKQTPLKNG